jgi:hypothetical protein
VTCAPVRKTVFIYELLTSDQEIEGKTFEGLDIHGPGLVYVVPGKPFTCDGCIFHLPRGGSVESILWEVPPGTEFVGPIGLVDCTFSELQLQRDRLGLLGLRSGQISPDGWRSATTA